MYVNITGTDILIDTICMLFYIAIVVHCMSIIFSGSKDVCIKHKIVYFLFMFASLIYIMQTFSQISTGYVASVRLWDIMNYTFGIAVLGKLHLTEQRIDFNFKANHPLLNKIPFV